MIIHWRVIAINNAKSAQKVPSLRMDLFMIPDYEVHRKMFSSRLLTQFEAGFHNHEVTPIAGWFIVENPPKMDDLGVFRETSICGFI
jgi:hypothetical protein